MKSLSLRLFSVGLGIIISASVVAEEMFMMRTQQTFPETMLNLQDEIKSHGYTLSRVQRVDIGLKKSGYKTDKYRIVFFAKIDEMKWLSESYPEWIPYLPLKVVIFSEGPDTLLIASDPDVIFVSDDPKLNKVVARWKKDIRSIFAKVGE